MFSNMNLKHSLDEDFRSPVIDRVRISNTSRRPLIKKPVATEKSQPPAKPRTLKMKDDVRAIPNPKHHVVTKKRENDKKVNQAKSNPDQETVKVIKSKPTRKLVRNDHNDEIVKNLETFNFAAPSSNIKSLNPVPKENKIIDFMKAEKDNVKCSMPTKNNSDTVQSYGSIEDMSEYSLTNPSRIVSEGIQNIKESSNLDSGKCDEISNLLKISPNYNEKELKLTIQQHIQEAVKKNKIYLIRGDIPYLEESLEKRGWVQKYETTKSRHLPYGTVSLHAPSLGNIYLPDGNLNKKYVIFNFLKHVPPDFIWDCRNDFTEWNGYIKETTYLNKLQRSFLYTSKLGLASILENVHWYNEDNTSVVQYPRSYNVVRDKTSFIDDYRQTAVVSLLKWFVSEVDSTNDSSTKDTLPIPLKQIDFAIKRCEEYIKSKNDEYLDYPDILTSSQEWEYFINDYIRAVHERNIVNDFQMNNPPENDYSLIPELYASAVEVLAKIKNIDPQYELNGIRNIWILKPSDLCCGVGIIMSHKLNYILKRIQDCGKEYFVVQKYIEKPLLVHDTKFDVRQWYLITKTDPLTIWIYKECLLRFSSRPYSFENYHETVHICNTAIQNKYIPPKNSIRSQNWDCNRLNDYLKTIGHEGEPWYEIIYPKMCQAVINTMLAAQEFMDKRKYSFELYGADFMIMDDLSVWLIEINTNPRMHPPSTKVTQRLYPDVLESLLKVVMDLPSNPNADTGNFTLAYEQTTTDLPDQLNSNLYISGKSIFTESENEEKKQFDSQGLSAI